MSGLFGCVDSAQTTGAAAIVAAMAQRVRHHAHHTTETYAATAWCAAGRLHIGIFNQAPQPVHNAQVLLWLCGEFYHQQERRAALVRQGVLADSADDAALALQVYLAHGAAGLAGLDGAFLVAVWDARSEELILVNDRYALYPHYFAHRSGVFVWAPEIKAVLCAPAVHRTLNLTAISEYLRFQQLLGEKSWFEDIRLIPPAAIVRYRVADDALSVEKYWDWSQIAGPVTIGFDEAVTECIRLFQRSIDAMRRGPHRIGVYLSGGLDSRTILGCLDNQPQPVATFTYGQPASLDVICARTLAARAGSDHHWFDMSDGEWLLAVVGLHTTLTEGMHTWINAHGMNTLAVARERVDVNLSGWDGGTILGGRLDEYALDAFLRAPVDEEDLLQRFFEGFCFRFKWPGLNEGEAASLFATPEGRTLQGAAFASLRQELALTAQYPADQRADYFYIAQHCRRSTQNMIVFGRSAIEQRCPFFDYRFVEFIYSLPLAIRATPAFHRAVITRRMPALARVPHDKDGLLPTSNRWQRGVHALGVRGRRWINRRVAPLFAEPTRLYADYEAYLRTDLRAWGEAILFDERTLARGWLQPDAVRSLWRRHCAGKELWTIGKIAPVIALELALRDFEL
jgi:asparagine synthase (glutamine-hydrolysing)